MGDPGFEPRSSWFWNICFHLLEHCSAGMGGGCAKREGDTVPALRFRKVKILMEELH